MRAHEEGGMGGIAGVGEMEGREELDGACRIV